MREFYLNTLIALLFFTFFTHASLSAQETPHINGVVVFSPANSDESEHSCPVCFEREPALTLPCNHTFCQQCIDEWRARKKEHATCPLCMRTILLPITPQPPDSRPSPTDEALIALQDAALHAYPQHASTFRNFIDRFSRLHDTILSTAHYDVRLENYTEELNQLILASSELAALSYSSTPPPRARSNDSARQHYICLVLTKFAELQALHEAIFYTINNLEDVSAAGEVARKVLAASRLTESKNLLRPLIEKTFGSHARELLATLCTADNESQRMVLAHCVKKYHHSPELSAAYNGRILYVLATSCALHYAGCLGLAPRISHFLATLPVIVPEFLSNKAAQKACVKAFATRITQATNSHESRPYIVLKPLARQLEEVTFDDDSGCCTVM